MAKWADEFTDAVIRNAPAFGLELSVENLQRLTGYYDLVMKWNDRLHLVAPCSPDEFAVRHILESLLVLKHLPANATVADVGSGAGLPIIPCLLVRDDLRATLFESSQRKGIFLKEALRLVTPPGRTQLVVSRFEDASSPPADFVTCRALERFSEKLPALIKWAQPGTAFAFFVGEALRRQILSLFPSAEVERIPKSDSRFLVMSRRSSPEGCQKVAGGRQTTGSRSNQSAL